MIKTHPSFCRDVSVPGELRLGCSTKVQALPAAASVREQQHRSKLSQRAEECRSYSRHAPLLRLKLPLSSANYLLCSLYP